MGTSGGARVWTGEGKVRETKGPYVAAEEAGRGRARERNREGHALEREHVLPHHA